MVDLREDLRADLGIHHDGLYDDVPWRDDEDPGPDVHTDDSELPPGEPPDDGALVSYGEEYPEDPAQVVCNNRQLRAVTKELIEGLRDANTPPSIFVRGGALTRVRMDERGRPIVEAMGNDVLRYRIARVVDTVRINNDGLRRDIPPPLDAIRDIAAAGDWPGFPPLEAVVEIPTLRSDGTVHHQPGYDPHTRLLHIPAKGLQVPAIPEHPTADQIAAAVQLIDEALHDFPFDGDADRANAIAAMITPIIRPAIDSTVPLALIDAPEPGTGKGLLVNLISVVATGRPAAMRPLAAHDDEVRKMITSTLAEGPTIVALDNIEDAIRSPSLALVLTSDEWADRLLGRSETVKLPNRATWIATGNNLQVGGDLARRCYRIRLDARQAKPYTRPTNSFRHPDLLGWAQEHRGDLIAALLTLARSWFADEQPVVDVPALGGFTPWARLVGSILMHAGITGFLDNLAQFHSEADTDADEWEAFLSAWRDTFGPKIITVAELLERLDPSTGHQLLRTLPPELATAVGRPGFSKIVGKQLRAKSGRHFGADDLYIVDRGKDRSKVLRWSVAYASEDMFATVATLPMTGTDGEPNPATPRGDDMTAGSAGFRGVSFKQREDDSGKSHINGGDSTPRNTANPAAPDLPPFPGQEPPDLDEEQP